MSQSHLPDNSYEQGIVDKHSTPGLRRNELTPYAKRQQLLAGGYDKKRVEDTLIELYPALYSAEVKFDA